MMKEQKLKDKTETLDIGVAIRRLSIREVLNYEITSNWLVSWIGFSQICNLGIVTTRFFLCVPKIVK